MMTATMFTAFSAMTLVMGKASSM